MTLGISWEQYPGAKFRPFEDENSGGGAVSTYFIALAGQTTDYILLSGGVGTDGILQAGH